MLSDKQITEFQNIYKNYFGEEISREEACEKGTKLLRLIELIYKPITESEHQKPQERQHKK